MIDLHLCAQNVDYSNIFCTEYTSIGIPRGDFIFLHELRKGKWVVADTMKIPIGTIAIDGNERKVLLAQKDKILFQLIYNCGASCQSDTLKFEQPFQPNNWIRGIGSTESEIWTFANTGMLAMYKDGGVWKKKWYSNPIQSEGRKYPRTYLNKPYDKIYLFGDGMYLMTQHDHDIRFLLLDLSHILESNKSLRQEIIPEDRLDFTLPKDAITVINFDQSQIALVYKSRMEFYIIKKDKSGWEKNKSYPDLYFDK